MEYRRIHRSSSRKPPNQAGNSRFAPRPFAVQAQPNSQAPAAREDLESEAFNQRMEQARARPSLLEILARKARTTAPADAASTPLVIQRVPIPKLAEEEKSAMKSWVREGSYQKVLNLLISKFPESRVKQGKANVRNVSDFSSVVKKSEIPPHGGFGVTLGGKLDKKSTLPEVYISDEHIKEWVEGDQFGSLVNTIQHELTHAHQSDDEEFIHDFGDSPDRIHVMEFEAFSGEIRNAYRALKGIDFDESRAGEMEWPTQADLLLAHNDMNKHYSKMSKPNQEKYHKILTAIEGYYPVVIDFLDRYYNPAALYKKFEDNYNRFARLAPQVFGTVTGQFRGEVKAYQDALNDYQSLNTTFSGLGWSGLEGAQIEQRRKERESVKEKIASAGKAKEESYGKLKKIYSDFYDVWEREKVRVYQIFVGMNTHEQGKFKEYSDMFDILPGQKPDFKDGASQENVTSVVNSYKAAVDKWNQKAQEVINISADRKWVARPEPVKADLNNPVVPPAVGELKGQAAFEPEPETPKETYIRQLNELASQSEYVKYHLQSIAPEGYKGFSLALLRKNLNAARQGNLTWRNILRLKNENPLVESRLESMGKLWFQDMTPLQLYDFYDELKKLRKPV